MSSSQKVHYSTISSSAFNPALQTSQNYNDLSKWPHINSPSLGPPQVRLIHINSPLITGDTPLFSLRRWAIYRMANLQPLSPTVPGFCLTPIALLSHRMVQPLGCHLQNWCSCADSEGAMGFTLSLSLSLLCLSPQFFNSFTHIS